MDTIYLILRISLTSLNLNHQNHMMYLRKNFSVKWPDRRPGCHARVLLSFERNYCTVRFEVSYYMQNQLFSDNLAFSSSLRHNVDSGLLTTYPTIVVI